jgi:VIT1/CCC1 family predicted Fe2+/Mn2+ transporter
MARSQNRLPVPGLPLRHVDAMGLTVVLKNRGFLMVLPPSLHSAEPHGDGFASRLNWLRAGVLGANDGIVSTAGLVVGVAGATSARGAIFTAGLTGLTAGAVAMALGEYVSVSSQRDSEAAQLATERRELAEEPDQEFAELAAIYESKGLTPSTAHLVATELTAHHALAAHAEAELRLVPEELANPWAAALASAVSFILGAVLPLVAILLPPATWRIPVTVAAVLAALALTGAASARIGGGVARRSVARVVIGGALGLAVTYGIGRLFGAALS